MGYAVGIALALVVVGFARWTGFDRDRAFYPAVVIVTASYYVLFAVMSGSSHALVAEAIMMAAFVLLAVAAPVRQRARLGGIADPRHFAFARCKKSFLPKTITPRPGKPGRASQPMWRIGNE